MLTSATSSQNVDLVEPGIHPVAARIRDIILAKASDGEPAMEEDFAEIDPSDLKTHFPAARSAANKVVVRQVDDERGYESRAQLLDRVVSGLLRKLPDEIALRQAMSRMGLSSKEIDDLWADALPTLADAFLRLNGKVH